MKELAFKEKNMLSRIALLSVFALLVGVFSQAPQASTAGENGCCCISCASCPGCADGCGDCCASGVPSCTV